MENPLILKRYMFWLKQKNVKDNVTAAVKNFVYCSNIPVTDACIEKTIREHPEDHSLYTIRYALNQWNVASGIYQIETDDLREISFPAIAFLHKGGGSCVVVTGVSGEQIAYIDPEEGPKREPLQAFASLWTGVVLLAEVTPQSGEPHHQNRRQEKRIPQNSTLVFALTLLLFALVLFAEIRFIRESLLPWLSVTLLKLITLLGNTFLFVVTYHEKSEFPAVLGPLKRWYICQNVQHRNKAMGLGPYGRIYPLDLRWVYGTGSFLCLSFSICAGWLDDYAVLFFAANLLLIPVVTYPVLLGAGTWSTFQLLLVGHLWVEELLLFGLLPAAGEGPGIGPALAYVSGFIVTAGGFLIVKPLLLRAQRSLATEKELSLFRSLPDAWSMVREAGAAVSPAVIENEISLGPPGGSPVLLILHPFDRQSGCMLEKLSTMLREPQPVGLTLRFGEAHKNDVVAEAVSYFTAFHQRGNGERTLEMLLYWYGLPTKQLKYLAKKYPVPGPFQPGQILESVKHQSRWVAQNQIPHLPAACIHGRVLPKGLTVDSLRFFLRKEVPPLDAA
jgi:hypothetical protein